VTLTQLSAFVLVARLGSVKAAAGALGVSEPAVSQALSALRHHFGDQLISRGGTGMTLTAGGARLLLIASQMVSLGADAEAAVRAAQGAPDQLRAVATSTMAEFVATPLVDAFSRKGRSVEASFGVAAASEMPVLVANRLADLALGPYLGRDPALGLDSEPIFRCRMVVVGSGRSRPRGDAGQWPWLVDASATDPDSDTSRLLRRLSVPEHRIRVFPNQTAAWQAVAEGTGVAPAVAHLAAPQLRRGELSILETPATPMDINWHVTTLRSDRRSAATSAFRRFLGTPEAMQLMSSPGSGVAPSRFKPPLYVTIWS
jgi:LysR family transcriptional regulator, low CO2-responsive transcriptional regulator